LKNNKVKIDRSENDPIPGVFDTENLDIEHLNLELKDVLLKKKSFTAQLSNFSIQEQSGIMLKKLALHLEANDQHIAISDINLALNNTTLEGSIQAKFTSLNNFIQDPSSSVISANLSNFNIDVQDAFYFSPDLALNAHIDTLSRKPLTGKISLDGTLQRIQILNFELHWGAQTALELKGSINNPTNQKKFFANITSSTLQTQKTDLAKWVDFPSSVQFPDSILLNSKLKGGLHSVTGDVQLSTSLGKVFLEGKFSDKDSIAFNLKLSVLNLKLAELLENEKLGNVTAQIVASGHGSDFHSLNANFISDFKDFNYSNRKLTGIKLAGNMTKGSGNAEFSINDPNVELTLKTRVMLDSLSNKINSSLNVVGIDLYALGLSSTDLRAKFKLEADFAGNLSAFDLAANLQGGVAVVNNMAIPISDFDLKTTLSDDTISLQLKSLPINIDFHANRYPLELYQKLESKILSYINDSTTLDTIANSTRMQLDMTIRPTPFLTQTIFKGLEYLDSTTVKIDFDENKDLLLADIHLPSAGYDGITIDSLYVQIEGDKETLKLNTGWSHLKSGMLEIQHTALTSQLVNKVISTDFSILEGKDKWIHFQSELRQNNDTLLFHILPKDLILAKQSWSVLPENEMQIASKHIGFTDFEFSNTNQKITYTNSQPGRKAEHLAILFENFQLGDVVGFLNSEKVIAEGTMQGDFVLENPFEYTGLVADLNIPDFKILEIPLGNLQLTATTPKGYDYEVNLSVQGENADLHLIGNYEANPTGADLHLDFKMDHLNVILFEELFPDYLSSVSGSARAQADLAGKMSDLKYSGSLGLQGVEFKVDNLNASFKLENEKVSIDNSGIHLDQFKITDAQMNDFILNGDIKTKDFTNPSFDLSLKGRNFEVINSTKKDNDLFYGKMLLDMDVTVKGDLVLPKVRGNVKVNKGSNLTYIIPQSELNLVEREGVVLFVNRKNPDDILTRTRQNENASSSTTGYDIRTNLTIDKQSSFNIIIDPKFNDNLTISGTGDFDFGLEPNGRMTLFGRYEVASGGYETNLYNLIKRRFEIASGSNIVWNGDLYNAKMDLRAVYNVNTSPSPLMAAQIAGASSNISNQYQQPIPFLVYINVDGVLVNPEISFNLDIPEDKQGAYGGQVYQAIQQLNTQPDELNKQVFSLLVLNQFFPSNGSNGGVSSIARDNVNQVLSDQLNRYSDKLLGKSDLQLGFNLNSYSENQAASGQTTNTQLDITASKQLLNDRLTVQVGREVGVSGSNTSSSEGSSIVGNVSLEYMLTKDQRLRLLGFSKNEYDNLIDGQLTVSGISLVFVREFNRLRELWEKEMTNQKINEPVKDK
jgi:translocation and assembly module TamB